MTQPVVPHTFTIEKRYAKPVAAVFDAFSDPVKKARWLGGGKDLAHFTQDFRVGGREAYGSVMGADTPFEGANLSSEGVYLDIVTDSRVVIGANMAMNGRPFSASLLTFEFLPEGDGTKLILTHQGAFFEHADGPEMRRHGWTFLLGQIAEVL